MLVAFDCLGSGNETFQNFNDTICPSRDNRKQKSMKQVTKNILCAKVGGI